MIQTIHIGRLLRESVAGPYRNLVTRPTGAAIRSRIQETLARVELTDGLTLPQLIVEAGARLPRDATVLAILGQAKGLQAKGGKRRISSADADHDKFAQSGGGEPSSFRPGQPREQSDDK